MTATMTAEIGLTSRTVQIRNQAADLPNSSEFLAKSRTILVNFSKHFFKTHLFLDVTVDDAFPNCGNATKKQIAKMAKMKLIALKNFRERADPTNFRATMEIVFW